MAKLADIFRQKPQETGAERAVGPLPATPAQDAGRGSSGEKPNNSGPAGPPAGALGAAASNAGSNGMNGARGGVSAAKPITGDDARSDTATRINKRTESLQHLVSDTRRKIDSLGAIKQAFDEIVLPFNDAMQALDQERMLSKDLSRQLDEKTAVQEKLRDELLEATSKGRLLESETSNLRAALAKARDALHAQGRSRIEFTEQIQVRDERIAELELQVEQGNAQRRSLGEGYRAMQEQILRAEQRISELQTELSAAGEHSAQVNEDNRLLRYAAEQAKSDAARVNRRLDEHESMVTAIRAELAMVNANYAETRGERDQLAGTVRHLKEQHQVEQQALNGKIEALQARAVAAERLLTETRRRLITRTEEARAFVCKTAEATIARGSAERRLVEFETSQGWRDRQDGDPNESRTALSQYLRALNLKSREMATANAAERLAAQNERNERLEVQSRVMRNTIEARVNDTNALQGDGTKRAEIESALEVARKDNVRLEEEIAALRSALREGGPTHPDEFSSADDVQMAEPEQATTEPVVEPQLAGRAESAGAVGPAVEPEAAGQAEPGTQEAGAPATALLGHEKFSLFRFRRSTDDEGNGRKSSAA